MRGIAPHDRFVLAIAALFSCAHLAWLPRHLEDIDSLNFALGLRDYDIAAHQPHPPGYPVFILVARGVLAAVSVFVADAPTQAAIAMALLSGIAGAIALLALYAVLRALVAPPTPILVTSLTAVAPLFWVTAARPLSDMPGLAAALTCQWLIVRAAREGARVRDASIAAVACGLAMGVRSQVTWLAVPLFLWLLWRIAARVGRARAVAIACTGLAALAVWALPMIAITGGVAAYNAALASQAGEDFEGVPMLVLQPGVGRLITALGETFVWSWGWWLLAIVVLAPAAAGLLTVYRYRYGYGGLATWLALGFVPYLGYHLLFQETETARYALPLVPFVATLAVMALRAGLGRMAVPLAASICVASLAVSVHAHRQYVSAGVTVSEALAAIEDAARASGERPHVLMHRRVWAETRRARAALQPQPSYDVLPALRSHEWQHAADVWQRDPEASVWWLIDPRRGDDVAIDPRARTHRRHFGWTSPAAGVLGGMRPHPFDWTTIDRPQWMLLDGWGLTPELAGLSAAAGRGPSTGGAAARGRGQAGAVTLVLGGRHIAPAAAAAATVDVRIGDRWQQQVQVPPGRFALVWMLPAGSLAEPPYLPLRVVTSDSATAPERIFLEQFDLQPAGVPVIALESGWYEPERDTRTGRRWRWVADESRLRIAGASGGVRLVVRGTWPRHYDRDPVLEIFAGDQRIGTHVLGRPFRIEQVVTADQLRADEGRLSWRVSPSFVAGERTGTADARRLALEIADVDAQAFR